MYLCELKTDIKIIEEMPLPGAKAHVTENERQAGIMNLPEISRAEYGREGEELPNYRGPADPAANRWPSAQYRHEPGIYF